MSRSQRHKIGIQNTSTRGEIFTEGRVAPAVLMQAAPGIPAVPSGPAGGPLQGSSMMGAIPLGWVLPSPKESEAAQPPALGKPAGNPGRRTFPIGPLLLLAIDPSEDPAGVWYVVAGADGDKLEPGDDITIEATGSSSMNGNFEVGTIERVDGNARFFVPGATLAAPIEGKGRLTITDGA